MPNPPLTLDHLARQMHEVLAHENTPASRERVASLLAAALADRSFVEAQFAADVSERNVLYRDPELGFCIVAHEYVGAKSSGPHDHGPSWAIYGQAAGETVMSDFERLTPAAPDAPGTVRRTRVYPMRQGDVHVYNEGDLHAPSRTHTTRLLRVEGTDLARVKRSSFQVVEDTGA
jgi:hypothetical protein